MKKLVILVFILFYIGIFNLKLSAESNAEIYFSPKDSPKSRYIIDAKIDLKNDILMGNELVHIKNNSKKDINILAFNWSRGKRERPGQMRKMGGVEIVPEKSAIIRDIQRPRYMDIDKKRIYIVENRVRIKGYSLDTFKKNFEINTRKGQGPGEYPWAPAIIVSEKNIFAKTPTKIAKYTKEGKYISEHKLRGRGIIFPFGNNYIFWYFHYDKNTKGSIILVDLINSKNKRIKRILTYKQKKFSVPSMVITKKGKGKIFLLGSERLLIEVSENKVYILKPGENIELIIYDLKGKLIKTIDKIDISKIKITPEDKLELMENFKYIEGFSEYKWKEYKKKNEFYHPEFFPRFKKLIIDQETIYIKTNKGKNRTNEFLVYDINGKYKRKILLPESKIWKIKNGKYYYLLFSDIEEEWRLNIINIVNKFKILLPKLSLSQPFKTRVKNKKEGLICLAVKN